MGKISEYEQVYNDRCVFDCRYYNTLEKLSKAVSKANDNAIQGDNPRKIANHLIRSLDDYLNLCLLDLDHLEKCQKKISDMIQKKDLHGS